MMTVMVSSILEVVLVEMVLALVEMVPVTIHKPELYALIPVPMALEISYTVQMMVPVKTVVSVTVSP